MENNYKPNSNKYKEEQRKAQEQKVVQKVISGQVVAKKKTPMQNLLSTFFSVDKDRMKDYVTYDVVIPTIKRTIITLVDAALNGGDLSRRKDSSTVGRVSYDRMYSSSIARERDKDREADRRNRSALDYDDIEFASRGDAVLVLESMNDILDRYGVVSIGDYYDLAGWSNYNTCIHKYGWTNLSSAKVICTWNGRYIIEFPKAMPI